MTPPYKIHFIPLGCAKNTVNCEQMMYLCRQAGYTISDSPVGTDVAVVNTCGFLASACEEAIAQILTLAALKEAGQVKKILVTGCMAQRYREEVQQELPEVDGMLGAGSYADIVAAIEAVMGGEPYSRYGDLNAPVDEFGRIRTTPPWYAYLRIAEGCSNGCAYCIIPRLRGSYRSRPMENVWNEARALADAGVKELLVIAQDITRYGTDMADGQRRLADLLDGLCKMDFHWIRLHYLYPLYPDRIDNRLIETIADQEKIVKYLDIPIQHCNDQILRRMNRRGNRSNIEDLLCRLRAAIPNLVIRTSIITGLPGEGAAEFEELCAFLREQKILRAGVFPFSPEDGTSAAKMPHVDAAEAARRANLVVDLQSEIMDAWNEDRCGETMEVLCEGFDGQAMQYVGRTYADSPEIDGRICFSSDRDIPPGTFLPVRVTGVMDGDLTGEAVEK